MTPARTRGGTEAVIYRTDAGGREPIHGAIRTLYGWMPVSWEEDGSFIGGCIEHEFDLAPEMELAGTGAAVAEEARP